VKYVHLLRLHIQKEDRVLFPLARRLLPEAVQGGMERSFRAASAVTLAEFASAASAVEALLSSAARPGSVTYADSLGFVKA
jgi:hypothetical protein